jgi:hypothetical protein
MMQIPFSQIIGAKGLQFSLFDFYGPIAGGFLGSILGMAMVLGMQLVDWAWHGFSLNAGVIITLFPMIFAVLYFAKKSKWALIVPVLAMLVFWANPEGRIAWFYALYWLIPIVAYFFYNKFLLARALGATFTAHAVGSVLFLWVFNLKAAVWLSLIPIVWQERGLMALGICATYVVFNWGLSFVLAKTGIKLPFVKINPKYAFGHK